MFQLPGNSYVHTMEDKITVTLSPEFDGAEIAVNVPVYTNYGHEDSEQRAIDISAKLMASKSPTHSFREMRALTTVRSDSLYTTQTTPNTIKLVGHISAAALRELEDLRDGGDMWLTLHNLRGVLLDQKPALRLHQTPASSNMTFKVRGAGEWAEHLQEVTSASFVDIMIPITDDPDLAIAAGRVRKAKELLASGKASAVAGELRQALEPAREFYRTLDKYAAAVAPGVAPNDRKEPERYAIVVQGTYAWISGFTHDDKESIKGLDMGPAEAVQALGIVGGILHRTARDKRAAAGTV